MHIVFLICCGTCTPVCSTLSACLLGRMVIVGMGMTALVCKPLFALCGSVLAKVGVAACITWVTCAKVRAEVELGETCWTVHGCSQRRT